MPCEAIKFLRGCESVKSPSIESVKSAEGNWMVRIEEIGLSCCYAGMEIFTQSITS